MMHARMIGVKALMLLLKWGCWLDTSLMAVVIGCTPLTVAILTRARSSYAVTCVSSLLALLRRRKVTIVIGHADRLNYCLERYTADST